jgi:phosphoheptose isomerase
MKLDHYVQHIQKRVQVHQNSLAIISPQLQELAASVEEVLTQGGKIVTLGEGPFCQSLAEHLGREIFALKYNNGQTATRSLSVSIPNIGAYEDQGEVFSRFLQATVNDSDLVIAFTLTPDLTYLRKGITELIERSKVGLWILGVCSAELRNAWMANVVELKAPDPLTTVELQLLAANLCQQMLKELFEA